jgi:hypothetical protein
MFGDLKSRPRCNSKVPRTLGPNSPWLNPVDVCRAKPEGGKKSKSKSKLVFLLGVAGPAELRQVTYDQKKKKLYIYFLFFYFLFFRGPA